MSATDARDELIEHLPAMRAFAISLTRNRSTADDMVQDTVEKAWTNFDKFEAGSNMRAWLFTILRNTYYSHHRKARREVSEILLEGLRRLEYRGYYSAGMALIDNEHRLQLHEGRQTHLLPDRIQFRRRIALHLGHDDLAAFDAEVMRRRRQVQALTPGDRRGDGGPGQRLEVRVADRVLTPAGAPHTRGAVSPTGRAASRPRMRSRGSPSGWPPTSPLTTSVRRSMPRLLF